MTNPDVTQNEDIKAWELIAGATFVLVLVGLLFLGGPRVDVASNDVGAVPLTYPVGASPEVP